MSNTVKGFLEFLKNVHLKKLSTPCSVKIVCGNQSADFDSVASAVTYAYCSYCKDPKHPVIPIISVPRDDLCLRRDIVRALSRMSITEDLLFFVEDLKSFKEKYGFINAILVDHNEVEHTLKSYVDNVAGIIDHHKDQKLYPNAELRIVKTTGSCSSLVFNYWHEMNADLNLIKDAALLSLGAAVIDTSNFHHKVEQPDLDALKIYEEVLPDFDRDAYYKQIRHDKDDLDGLSISDILRKDYKEFEFGKSSRDEKLIVGIASTVKPLNWFYSKYGGESNFREACLEAQKQHNVDIFVVMTAWLHNSDFRRELVIVSHNTNISQQIIDGIQNKLDLQEEREGRISESNPYYFKVFNQLNVSASRKQVAPYLKEAFEAFN